MVLPLPNMFTASAVHGLRWSLLGQLPLADWARLGHYISHNLASVLRTAPRRAQRGRNSDKPRTKTMPAKERKAIATRDSKAAARVRVRRAKERSAKMGEQIVRCPSWAISEGS